MRIVFFGSGDYLIPIVEKLKDHGLVLVVTTEPQGKLTEHLKTHSIPFVHTNLKNPQDIKRIRSLKPDLGVLASYGAIVPAEVIDVFPMGILNIHPSLLPKYKGPSPIQYAILDGVQNSGVTIIRLDDQVDHGPIISQKSFKLRAKDTLKHATELMFSLGADMIQEVIQNIEDGLAIRETPQRTEEESWTQKISKNNSQVFIENPPSRLALDRMIRAFYPWPGVYLTVTLYGDKKILKLLPHNMYQVEGKRPMSYKDFLNGYGNDAAYILAKLER